MSYEMLDTIADLFNPLWLLTALILAAKAVSVAYENSPDKGIRTSFKLGAALTLSLALYGAWVYGWMFIDKALYIWQRADADYSTHTALAVALTWYLVFFLKKFGRCITWLSLAGYCGLMLYQAYHSVMDILSTGLFTLAGLLTIDFLTKKSTLVCPPSKQHQT